jgi:hypothetical protein
MGERARAAVAVLVLGLVAGHAEAEDLKQRRQSQLGRTEDERELLNALKDGTYKYRSLRRENVVTRFYVDSAVITGKAALHVASGGQTLDATVFFLCVYVWRHERWEMVAWQSTRVAAP